MGARYNFGNQTPFYRLALQSGILTGVAAGSATAGHLFSFSWFEASPSKRGLIQRLRVRWQTLTAFTAAQEIAFKFFRLTSYSAAHTGGLGITKTTPNLKKAVRFPVPVFNEARIGNTGALTAGVHNLDTEPFGGLNLWSQAGAAPNVLAGETVLDERNGDPGYLLDIGNEEGFLIRNEIAMGAAGTGRLLVEVDWAEVPRV